MIETLAVSTITLARVLGVFILAIGLAVLRSPARFIRIRDEFEASSAPLFLAGVIALAIGLVLVTFHNFWSDPLAILVSLCGWLILFKGLAALIAPGVLLRFGRTASAVSRLRIAGAGAVILGVVLLALSFMARATLSL